MDVLCVRDLEMGFAGRPVLQDVSLRVRAGEVVGLTGPNGAGKSTLLRLAAGLLALPDAGRGRIRVLGTSPAAARRAGHVGWSSAAGSASFTRRLALRTNLETAARLAGLPGREARDRCEVLAEALDFRAHLDVPADRCSSGVRQRAALARALLHTPALLLLDEPLRSVDAPSSARLAASLRATWRREAVVWVSHSREELALVADRVVVLEDGVLARSRLRAVA